MKKTYSFLVLLSLSLSIIAQSPQAFNYQAVYRDVSGNIVANENVAVVTSILQGAVDGTTVFTETHIGATNDFGLLSLTIGSVNTTDFPTIDWSAGPYFLNININGNDMGTTQLLSVPYALHATTAESLLGGANETDPVFTASASAGISGSDITNWTTAYGWGDHAGEGYLGFAADLTNTGYMMQVIHPNLLFKGKLHTSGNEPVNGILTMNASIYDSESAPSPLWSESSDLEFTEGYFELRMGQISPLDDEVLTQAELYLELSIAGDAFQRVKLEPVWKAHIAEKAYSLAGSAGMGDGSGLDADLLDGHDSNYFLSGEAQTLSDVIALDNSANDQIKNLTDPTDDQDAATKKYVDDNSYPTYSVGDFAQGGVVFWVDESGQHGLVCAKEDQDGGSGIYWNNGTYTDTEAHGDGVYAGEMNTTLIMANQGSNSNDYAAGVCANYTVTESGVTYGDWYLPSKEELNLMYQNKATIDNTARANGGTDFASGFYWSSTEYNFRYAWRQYFDLGGQSFFDKSTTARVRAVRAF